MSIKNLNLFKIRFPITAIVSILHRISGVLMFLFLPVLVIYWDQSLVSEFSFNRIVMGCKCWSIKLVLWLMFSSLIYHFIAGVRHLIMDLGIGETKISSKITSIIVFIVSGFLIVTAGIMIW